MGGGGIIIIRRKLNDKAFYQSDAPAAGVGKYLGKVQNWHVLAAVALVSFVLGAVIF